MIAAFKKSAENSMRVKLRGMMFFLRFAVGFKILLECDISA